MQDNEYKRKRKAGLHKEISSIFKGVPIPGGGGAQQPSGAATPEQSEQGPVRPPAPEPGPPRVKPRQPVPKETTGKSRWQQTWQKIKNKLFKPQEGVSSTRQKTMVILVPVLFIALIFVLIPVFKRPPRKIPKPSGVEPTEVATEAERKIDWQIPAPYPTGIRDPMKPGTAMTAGPNGERPGAGRVKLIVKGIVYSEDNPVAVIGTQLVHEGDKVSNATIIKINQDHVEF